MRISIVAISSLWAPSRRLRSHPSASPLSLREGAGAAPPGPGIPAALAVLVGRPLLTLWVGLALGTLSVRATPVVGPWEPKFKGVEFSVSTNVPGVGNFSNLQVVSALRIDLADPDIQLLTTPRNSNYVANVSEIGALTVSDFLHTNHLQAAINANFFDGRNYYLPAGTPMDVYGLAISQGIVVSEQDGSDHAAVILFDKTNSPTVLPSNWPAANVDNVYTAVAGNYPLVIAGKNVVSPNAREVDPRTVFGVSQDRRYLYVVAIDGRQPGYSEGANDYESAEWLLLLGAYDGVNMDGGGSTTLVIEDSTGVPLRLNQSSAVADSGRERTVGSHFGVYAKPLARFINEVVAKPSDTTAEITWTTEAPATSEVQYGVTAALGASTGPSESLVTNHLARLAGLTPDTGYYFRIVASTNGAPVFSPTYFFTTTNYVTSAEVFAVTQEWRSSTAKMQSADWTMPAYDDSAWTDPGAGLLWIDVRAVGPNAAVTPKNTVLPADPSTGFPFITYYFRTHFQLTNLVAGTALQVSAYVDDGAIFYLNGVEVYRLRMPADAGPETLASSFGCDGDATCADEFKIPPNLASNLKVGDNVLAVEVHNYNARSADTTFGMGLTRIEPVSKNATLQVSYSASLLTLEWSSPGMTLQSAEAPSGPWTDIAGQSPFNVTPSEAHQYYRLRQ